MSAPASGRNLSTYLVGVPVGALLTLICGAVLIAMAFGGQAGCLGNSSAGADVRGVPAKLIPIYQQAAAKYKLGRKGPAILAGINYEETRFGTNLAVSSAEAEGWMQFLPSSWEAFGVDANSDGIKDPYNPWDAIFAAARLLRYGGAPENWHDAIYGYNHAEWYVEDVFANAEKWSAIGSIEASGGCHAHSSSGANLGSSTRLFEPKAFKAVPSRLWVGGDAPQEVDARIWPDAVWLLEAFDLRVTAARESGHQTHGDGTAMDLVPAAGSGWDATALRAAVALGWTSSCGYSGTAPVCPLAPAIQFVGYNGYPSHGDPAHAGTNAHLHVSWKSSSFGCPGLCPPREWVDVFR